MIKLIIFQVISWKCWILVIHFCFTKLAIYFLIDDSYAMTLSGYVTAFMKLCT